MISETRSDGPESSLKSVFPFRTVLSKKEYSEAVPKDAASKAKFIKASLRFLFKLLYSSAIEAPSVA